LQVGGCAQPVGCVQTNGRSGGAQDASACACFWSHLCRPNHRVRRTRPGLQRKPLLLYTLTVHAQVRVWAALFRRAARNMGGRVGCCASCGCAPCLHSSAAATAATVSVSGSGSLLPTARRRGVPGWVWLRCGTKHDSRP